MPNITQIPAPRVPIIDEKTGLMSREWYRFFINIFALTGDGSNAVSLQDLQLTPREELGTLASKNSVSVTSDVSGVLPTANGGTGLSFFEANGVVYASSTSVLETSSTLVFDGSSLGLNGTPAASAILDGQSTTQGFRFPNMTTAQKNAISSPATGLVIFDITLSKLCVYTGAAWQTVTSA